MEAIYIAIIIILLGAVVYLFWKQSKKSEDKSDAFVLLQNQMAELRNILDSKLGESAKDMRESVQNQFRASQELIKDITRELTEVKETSKRVFDVTEELKNLQKILKNQKQRGSLGEAGLELVLSNALPPNAYEMQHRFGDGTVVDAVVKTKEGFLPVDAKFSLDNYIRITEETDEERKKQLEKEFKNDLKKRIDETAKYIKADEGTLPFAFMFIPAEGIYYDLLINEVGNIKLDTRSLLDYAEKEKKVTIVSPTTFSAYLKTVYYGLRALQIEKGAQNIAKNVEGLRKHILKYEEYLEKLGNSLSTTVSHYNASYKEFKKVDKDMARITGGKSQMEVFQLEKPKRKDEE